MRQLRIVLVLVLAVLTVSQRFRGLLLGLTILAVNELVLRLTRLDGPRRTGRRRWIRRPSWPGWLPRPRWVRVAASWWRLPRWVRLPEWLRRRPVGAGQFPSYDRIVGELAWARFSRRDFDLGLRRRLLDAAALQLLDEHGIDLEGNPAAARQLLGDEAWTVLAPDLPPSDDRSEPGVELPALERTVAAIERLGRGSDPVRNAR